MLRVKEKVSSCHRKAAIKAGNLSSTKRRRTSFSGREKSRVMDLFQRSGVVNPPKHSFYSCKRNKLF